MIKSMTGFASLTREAAGATIAVTIRSLNHRHLDVQLRLPQSLADLESRIRAQIQRRIARGRVELALAVQSREVPSVDVEFNEAFGAALAAALETAREHGLISGVLTPGDLLRFPQAFSIRERPLERDVAAVGELADAVEAAIE